MPGPISGSGVNLTGNQTVAGDKTFTGNTTLSDQTKRFLVGTSTVPVDSSSTGFSDPQIMILAGSGSPHDTSLVVLGSYRVGSSGERYVSIFGNNGGFSTNGPVVMDAVRSGGPTIPSSSLAVKSDTTRPLILWTAFDRTQDGRLMIGYGETAISGTFPITATIWPEGMLELNNPYAALFPNPQIVLRDSGAGSSTPLFAGSMRVVDGRLAIGSYTLSSNAQGEELQIIPGKVLVSTLSSPTSTALTFSPSAGSNLVLNPTSGGVIVINKLDDWSILTSDSKQRFFFGTNGVTIMKSGSTDIQLRDASDNVIAGLNNTAATFPGTVSGTHIATGTATSCTGATIGTGSKANAGFVTSTTTGVSTIVITFPVTAATGWSCIPTNTTTANLIRQTAKSTTTATISGTTVTGDVIQYIAMPY